MCVCTQTRRQAIAATLAAVVVSSFAPLNSEPAHPAWWSDPAREVTNSKGIQNKGVANIGQLKHIATQAHAELQSILPGGAGFNLPFSQPPANPDAAWYTNQKKALNLGQLKAVAKPFYDRLNAISPAWIESQFLLSGLTTLGTDYFQDANSGYFYPWNPTTPVAENYKPANIGQLKLVFALHFRENTDNDSMFDLWEYAMIRAHLGSGITDIASLTDAGDIDNDAVSNLAEYQNGLDPFLSDSDADGLGDQFRIGLLGSWNLNGAVGTTVITDSSLNDLNGELLSGTRIPDGVSGGAVSLTATQQMKITPAPSQLNVGDNGSNFTVSFWLRLHASHEPGWNTILQKGNTSSKRTFHVSLKPDGQKLHARLTSSSSVNEGIDTSAHSMVPGEWTHISYVHGDGQLKLYINGDLDSTANVGQSIANDDPFHIGKSAWLRGVNADFDDIMIHARALSALEVSGLTDKDTDGDGSSDKLENETGTDANDASSGGREDGAIDSDKDGINNAHDAVHADRVINWKRTPVPRYAVISTGIKLTDAAPQFYPTEINGNGRVVFRTLNNSSYQLWRPASGVTAIPKTFKVGEESYSISPEHHITDQNSVAWKVFGGGSMRGRLGLWSASAGWSVQDTESDNHEGSIASEGGGGHFLRFYKIGTDHVVSLYKSTPTGLQAWMSWPDPATSPRTVNHYGDMLMTDGSVKKNTGTTWSSHTYGGIGSNIGRVPDSTGELRDTLVVAGHATIWVEQENGNLQKSTKTQLPAVIGSTERALYDISNLGQILPRIIDPSSPVIQSPNIWQNGKEHKLDDLVGNGWSDLEGHRMSHNGLIVAEAKKKGSATKEYVLLLPVEIAPEVLAVNSDFDEGRIDSATGYAIPDCDDVPGVDRKTGAGNGELRIDTEREHLDGLYANDERVTDDMHKGWFGVLPKQLGDDFWDGATVTIRKIDKIDEDTGRKESGQIRFYAKWGDPKFGTYYGIEPYKINIAANGAVSYTANNLVTSGVNGKDGEGVYGSTSTIPDDAEFWMEGVRPGKITLEWRLQKGDIDVKHEQTFLVATQKSKQEWIDEVYYQIKLQSTFLQDILSDPENENKFAHPLTAFPIDFTQFNPDNGFFLPNSRNYVYIQTVYYYYRQLFRQNPEELYWAGMAKTAGAAVYAGMVDMNAWRTWIFADHTAVDKILHNFMIRGNREIFLDQSWAHHAYVSSGIWTLRHLKEKQEENGSLMDEPLTDYVGWEEIDVGLQDENINSLREGNNKLLRREQEIVMQPLYNVMKDVWLKPNIDVPLAQWFAGIAMPPARADGKINIDQMFSINGRNPMLRDTGPKLRDITPGGLLSDLDHRWAWIDNAQNGMLQIWLGTSVNPAGYSANQRANWNMTQFKRHAWYYSMIPTDSPIQKENDSRSLQFPPSW